MPVQKFGSFSDGLFEERLSALIPQLDAKDDLPSKSAS